MLEQRRPESINIGARVLEKTRAIQQREHFAFAVALRDFALRKKRDKRGWGAVIFYTGARLLFAFLWL